MKNDLIRLKEILTTYTQTELENFDETALEDFVNKHDLKFALREDVYSPVFTIAFYQMLEKFVNEYDDMANMAVIKTAKKLLKDINNAN